MTARTRLVCTLGRPKPGGTRPQDAEDYVAGLVRAGMDVARVNLSHAQGGADFVAGRAPSYDGETAMLRRVRAAAAAAGPERHVAVLLDLQGVKVRLRLPEPLRDAGLAVAAGGAVRVRVTREPQPGEIVCDGSPAFLRSVAAALARRGALTVAVGDGDPFLACERIDGDVATLRAPEACVLAHGKGVTFRGVHVEGEPPLTIKDRADLAAFAIPALLTGEADSLALSFVQSGDDIAALRRFVAETHAWFRSGPAPRDPEDARLLARLDALRPDLRAAYAGDLPPVPIVAKIETAAGVAAIEEILAEADGVMVARGDLGLHEPPEDVPGHQKAILRSARWLGRPAIVATQMLESMLTSSEPRRSEATDVFNAVLDGAGAVMLSGETAVGDRPHLAAATLARIARAAERWEDHESGARAAWLAQAEREVARRRPAGDAVRAVTDLVTLEAVRMAEALGARAIVAATRSGHTARSLARFDPLVPIVAIVPDARVARSLAFTGSVTALAVPCPTAEEAIERGLARAAATGLIAAGDTVVVTSARLGDPPGATTSVAVRWGQG